MGGGAIVSRPPLGYATDGGGKKYSSSKTLFSAKYGVDKSHGNKIQQM